MNSGRVPILFRWGIMWGTNAIQVWYWLGPISFMWVLGGGQYHSRGVLGGILILFMWGIR